MTRKKCGLYISEDASAKLGALAMTRGESRSATVEALIDATIDALPSKTQGAIREIAGARAESRGT